MTLTLALAMPALAWASPAAAQVRGGEVSDARDVTETIGGASRDPDVESVRVSYDPSGTVSATVRLYDPWTVTSRSDPNVSISLGSQTFSSTYTCSSSNTGDALLIGYLDPSSSIGGSVQLTGYNGSVAAQRTVSPDGRETTFTASLPQMAGRNYICATSIELYRPDPDGHCSPSIDNCERIAYSYDGDQVGQLFFHGFQPTRPACDDDVDNDGDGRVDLDDPDCGYYAQGASEGPPPTACANRRDDDGDGLTDTSDPGCRGKRSRNSESDPAAVRSRLRVTSLHATRSCHLDVRVAVLPNLTPARLFPLGKVQLTLRGLSDEARGYRTSRRLALAASRRHRFKRLAPGRYRVTGRYLGDPFRLKSPAQTRTVKVCLSR